MQLREKGTIMKRTILIVLYLAATGTFAIVQAEENIEIPDCCNCETLDEECCCGGSVDGCEEDCSGCDESDCGSECEDSEICDSDCDDCTSEEEKEEEFQHCGGCH